MSPYTGERYGIFVAVWHLVRDGRVTEDEEREYWDHRNWYEEHLPLPPFYAEGNPRRAITWFKESAMEHPLLSRLSFYKGLAEKYQLRMEVESTDQPGEILYEDDFQVAAVRVKLAGRVEG
ncbi:hypothetical protein HNR46_003119 [Haloferula luteola]|uniref:Uncharacterized protein n=1 Tax=Haloferula luteola TaxID=595692 RepID=A0A840VGB3_9BACT|nr:hypothetical protein [Haloferula luteola]MBB5352870.1 hypothetical protein [Haloferula luteola]